MKRRHIAFLAAVVLMLTMIPMSIQAGGGDWLVKECTCANPVYDATKGDWFQRPTCVSNGIKTVTCQKCGYELDITVASEPSAHVYPNRDKWDCTQGIKCQYYGQKDKKGNVCTGIKANTKYAQHDYKPATCIAPKTCSRSFCQHTEGTRKLVHDESDYVYTSCTAPGHCKTCGIETAAKGHQYSSATCLHPKRCTKCGQTWGNPLPHNYTGWNILRQATCTTSGLQERRCRTCGTVQRQGIAPKHTYNAKGICTKCGRKK